MKLWKLERRKCSIGIFEASGNMKTVKGEYRLGVGARGQIYIACGVSKPDSIWFVSIVNPTRRYTQITWQD